MAENLTSALNTLRNDCAKGQNTLQSTSGIKIVQQALRCTSNQAGYLYDLLGKMELKSCRRDMSLLAVQEAHFRSEYLRLEDSVATLTREIGELEAASLLPAVDGRYTAILERYSAS